MKNNLYFVFLLVLVSYCTLGCWKFVNSSAENPALALSPPPPESEHMVAPKLKTKIVMDDLSNPWDLAFSEKGLLFYTEKCKGLSVKLTDGTTVRLFGIKGSTLVAKDLFCQGQSGMHGVALHPQFSSNHTVFVYMPSNLLNPRTNRVVKLVLNKTSTKVLSRKDIVTDISFKHKGNRWGGAGAHSGGRIRFGPDRFLYVTTGDNHNGQLPQDTKKLGGKVLRIDENGKAAPGNQSPGDPRIFSYGHRNVQGIAFQPKTGAVVVAEHGPGHSDEVTFIRAGGNAGWSPAPQKGVRCPDNYCGYISNRPDGKKTSMTDLEVFPNAMRPLWSNDGESNGMGPCTFLTGKQWKGWDGHLAVGIMGTQDLHLLKVKKDNTLASVSTADIPSYRMRSLVQGPDGALYMSTDSGEILKIEAE
tara:strand:+ start:21796 stop:23043 length:1248 start_codon:yes stop_codon:yes gene_type:complete